MARKSRRPGLQELVELHVRASMRRDELLKDCQRHLDAGRKAKAKRCLAAAEELQEVLTQLERAVWKPRRRRG
jgi:hypothetical protein